jgi:DNA polymerase-3 subunit epsilon/oligoribonuclease
MKGIFLDLETSGLDSSKHSVLEIALKLVDLRTSSILVSYESVLRQNQAVWDLRDPESIQVNGFSWERMQSGQEPELVAKEVTDILEAHKIRRGSAVFICQNPSFDRSFFRQLVPVYEQERLLWPYHWLDFASMYWALRLKEAQSGLSAFPQRIQLSKDAIAQHHKLPTEARPHRAMNGVDHLLLCYGQIVGWVPEST